MKKVIKVLHTEWSDGWGGQEIRIINEMLAVREQGIEVFLACRKDSIIKQKALANKIPVFTLPFNGNTDIKTVFALISIIKKHSINIVNTHSGKDTWVGGFAAKISSIRFVRTRHLSNTINPRRFNFINELADYIITTGESVRQNMINLNRIKPDRIKSIPSGIDENIFNPNLYDREKCRKEFSLEDDEIAIGIIAIFRQFKRHDLFLEMARNLKNMYPEKKLVFLLAGTGPKKNSIIKLIKKLHLESSVKLLGHVDRVPELLVALDVFVQSSDSKEGVSQSVMQALMMNKEVVATDCGSTKDLFRFNNFQIVRAGSLSSIVRAVSLYIEGNCSNYDRNFMVNNFSKLKMTKNILEIYKQLLK